MTRSGPEFRKKGFLHVVSALACSVLLAALWLLILTPAIAQTVPARTPDVPPSSATTPPTLQPEGKNAPPLTTEDRVRRLEAMLSGLSKSAKDTEERSFYIKMVTYDLIAYLRWIVAALLAIALVFPLTIWLMSRRRILGLSGLSDELAATLLTVEERQAKLANILKEIQGEVDYLHTMSVPDLKGLIAQAERYLEQNEKDLEKAGSRKDRGAGPESTPPRQ
jgi:hypothetical protein